MGLWLVGGHQHKALIQISKRIQNRVQIHSQMQANQICSWFKFAEVLAGVNERSQEGDKHNSH